MDTIIRKAHWENVFETKDTTKVSWYQPVPETSIRLLQQLPVSKTAKIIDVGAGDSFLADNLIKEGYNNISLLDISGKALNAIKNRLEENVRQITFIQEDVLHFNPDTKFDIWHDRAVFHFFTEKDDIEKYVHLVTDGISANGYLIIGTFSETGPDSCSGLSVQRYSEENLVNTFSESFTKVTGFTENHTTPSKSIQNFRFCVFQKK